MSKQPVPEMFGDDTGDPEMRRQRIEAAHELHNKLIDVINQHMAVHGNHDPLLNKILATALSVVADEIASRVDPMFQVKLAALLIASAKESKLL